MSEERTAGLDPAGDDDLDILDDELDIADEPDDGDDGVTVDPDAEPPPAEPEPPRVSREQRRIQALRRREKEARDEIRRLQQINENLVQSRPQFQQPVDPQVQRQRDIEAAMRLPPEEQPLYWQDLADRRAEQRMQRFEVQMSDRLDRQAFDAFKQNRPHAQRLSAKVEEALTAARQQGMNPTRQAMYYALFGMEVDEKAARQTPRQRQQAERRVASQRTTAGGTGRSTAATPPRQRQEDSIEAVEERLKSVAVGDIWGGRQDF